MLDKKKALEVLGLKEDSSRNEIEQRYYVLLRKNRMKSTTGEQEDGHNIDEITEAYDVLTGKIVKVEEFKPSPLFQKLNIDERKVRNFFHYHKWHIIIGIVSVIVLVSIIKSITQPRPDFNIAFIGEIYYYEGVEYLEEKVPDEIEQVNLVSVDGASYMLKENEYEMTMKATVLFAGGDVDVFIMDRPRFRMYAEQGGLLRLEETLESLGIPSDDETLQKAISEDDDKQYVYGIDVSESELFNEIGIVGNDMIISIDVRVDEEDYHKAVEFMKMVLKESQAE